MVMSSFSWMTRGVRFSSECGKTLEERTFGMQLMREVKSPSNINGQTSDSSIISFIQDIDWPLKFGKDDAVDVY